MVTTKSAEQQSKLENKGFSRFVKVKRYKKESSEGKVISFANNRTMSDPLYAVILLHGFRNSKKVYLGVLTIKRYLNQN